ncbi:MAG TPA: proteasome accessory factor PafA2 family protein, partial [Candidatus Acidoferrales bacterium]|nr:proteasome accessory factor PafA2 family protein [Candidatus Acidoferrales bacterium]
MAQPLFGVETEYAVSGLDHQGQAVDRRIVLRKLMELARERHTHLLDGTGRGIFLASGARFYVDFPDHPEFCSPECTNPWDVVRYLRAGDRILSDLAEELPEREPRLAEVVAVRSNVDYVAGTTWGSHS